MKDFLELCKTRQSCRNFNGKPVEREKLTKCVEAAHFAPSGCNAQPWSFVVVDDPKLLPEVAKCAQPMEGLNAFTSKAGAFIVVLEEHAVLMPMIRPLIDSQYFAKGDLGAATLSICLEAADQGLGACILGMYNREKLCQTLGIPTEKQFGALIALGYPADETIRLKTRKPMDEIVRYV
ncbi:nitroreductase family protein [Synergistaceae bacterium OttesenSCG-928-I11]|nr:nitroreductase family protein [Synergistaceae bacterium OttesenSCG-928-I11]